MTALWALSSCWGPTLSGIETPRAQEGKKWWPVVLGTESPESLSKAPLLPERSEVGGPALSLRSGGPEAKMPRFKWLSHSSSDFSSCGEVCSTARVGKQDLGAWETEARPGPFLQSQVPRFRPCCQGELLWSVGGPRSVIRVLGIWSSSLDSLGGQGQLL